MSQETIDIVVKENGSQPAAAAITNIGTAADKAAVSVDKLNAANANSATTATKAGAAAQGVATATDQAANAHARASQAVQGHTASMQQGAQAAEQLRGVLVALGLSLGADQWVKLTDAYANNLNQLRQNTSTVQEFTQAQATLRQISDETFSSLDTNIKLYTQLSQAGRDLNITHEQMFNVIHVLNDALRSNGTDAQQAAASLSYLGIALQTGQVNARAILPMLREMPSLVQALADKFGFGGNATAGFVKAVESGMIPVRNIILAIGNLDNTLQGGVRSLQNSSKAYDDHGRAIFSDYEKTLIAKGELLDLSAAQKDADNGVIDLSNHTHQLTTALDGVAAGANRVTQTFLATEPTITDGWTRVRNAIYEYVGQQDRVTGSSAAVAQALMMVASNARLVFGSVEVIIAALTAYTAVANAARIATLLFGASFSPLAAAVAIIAAAGAAIVAFGQNIKLTADGSITALGALYGVISAIKSAFMELWNIVGQSAGAWGQMALGVMLAVAALRLLAGIDVISWLVGLTQSIVSMTIATYAALGPWGLLAAAVVGAALAAAYYSGTLDKAISALKDTLQPAIDGVVAKMKEMTAETDKANVAVKDFGKTNEMVWPNVVRALGSASSAMQNVTAGMTQDLSSLTGVASATSSSVGSSLSNIVSDSQAASNSLAQLVQQQQQMSSSPAKSLAPGQSAYGGSTHAGIVWNNSGILTSHDLNPGAHFASGGSFVVGGQGGTDSQVVKFMASPNERVTVETPEQAKRNAQGGSGTVVHVAMTVNATDANSFKQNESAMVMALQSKLTRALARIGG